MTVRYLPVHQPRRRLSIDALSRGSGVHPDQVRRFVALGLLRADRDTGGRLWFPPSELAALARIERLRRGLSLNYAALGVVIELLDQIRALEDELRKRPSTGTDRSDAGRSR
jgi:DNA-binding transcriptional MerR regulator